MGKRKDAAAIIAGVCFLTLITAIPTMAFTGWVEEDSETIYYLDRSGQRVADTWMKRDKDWVLLDENGFAVRSQFVDFDGRNRYLDENGRIAKNKWVSTLNIDDECDQDVDILWYFFDNKGDMVKDNTKPRKINVIPKSNGSYFFDADGHMLSGWLDVENDGEMETYYLGEDDDGRMVTEWRTLEPREDTEPEDNGRSYNSIIQYYFDWDGKQITGQEKKVRNHYYQFDENGAMITGWYPGVYPSSSDFAINTYYDKETGARQENWIYAFEQEDYDESGEQFWYYLDKKGQVFNEGGKDAEKFDNEKDAQIALKKIDKHYYGFDACGRMITGLIDTRDENSENEEFIDENYLNAKGAVASKVRTMEPGVYYFEAEDENRLGQLYVNGKKTMEAIAGNVQFCFDKNGRTYAAIMVDGQIYDLDGRLLRGDGQTEIMSVPYDIYKKNADEEDDPIIPYGNEFIVTSGGKVKEKGTVKIEGTTYIVENYMVVGVEE